MRPHCRTLGVALATLISQALLMLPLPWLQGIVIDQLGESSNRGWLLALAAGVPLTCLLGRMLLGWLSGSLMSRVSLEFVRALTDSLHQKLQRLPLAWFDRQETGQLMARLTSDVGTLLIFLSSGSLQLIADLVLATGIFVVLAILSWPLALVSLAAVPMFWLSHRWHSPRITAMAKSVQQQNAAVYALLSERLSAIRTIRASGSEQRELAAFDLQLDEQVAQGRQNLNANAAQSLAALLIGGLAAGVIVCLAALLIQHRWLTLGEAVAFIAYLALLYQPLIRLAQFYGGIAATLAAVERITELLDEPESSPARPARPLGAVRGELEFRNVSSRYGADGTLALDRLNLHIRPGTTVGIYGPSGAGKTTLLTLVPRLYELAPGQGRILLDGRNIRSLRLPDLRRQVRYVPQQARLFEGTIRSNLTYAAQNTSEGLLWRALEAVALDELVESLPQGLDTRVGERGASLSGGQRQRLALARALIARPRVLLLDDCLSALDAQTAARVRERITELRPDQTRLIVSHNPVALINADWLVVLDRGRLVRQGRPRDVLVDGVLRPELGSLPQAGHSVI